MTETETYFPTGAIVCTRQRKRGRGFVEWLMSVISWLIARASRMPFEPKTRATHTALVIKGGTLEEALILEALWPRVQISPLSKYAGHMTVYRSLRINPLICNLMAHTGNRLRPAQAAAVPTRLPAQQGAVLLLDRDLRSDSGAQISPV